MPGRRRSIRKCRGTERDAAPDQPARAGSLRKDPRLRTRGNPGCRGRSQRWRSAFRDPGDIRRVRRQELSGQASHGLRSHRPPDAGRRCPDPRHRPARDERSRSLLGGLESASPDVEGPISAAPARWMIHRLHAGIPAGFEGPPLSHLIPTGSLNPGQLFADARRLLTREHALDDGAPFAVEKALTSSTLACASSWPVLLLLRPQRPRRPRVVLGLHPPDHPTRSRDVSSPGVVLPGTAGSKLL